MFDYLKSYKDNSIVKLRYIYLPKLTLRVFIFAGFFLRMIDVQYGPFPTLVFFIQTFDNTGKHILKINRKINVISHGNYTYQRHLKS